MSAEHLFRFAKDKILSDPVRGLVLLEKAAKQGSRNALYELIRAYQGFRPELREYTDHEKAYALCREYCAEGDGHVFFLLAEMYRLGLSVERNEKEARRWYLKAAKRNDIRAMEMLALFFQREYALFWYKKILSFPPSAENLPNRQNAARALGDLYRFGIGVEKNFETAASWYVKCVELRGEKSPLAALYRENGLSQDAVRVFSEAAEEGESEAMYALGSMYRMGEGIKQDKKTAFSWFEKAAVSDLRACDMLGDMCRTGAVWQKAATA